MLDVEVHAKHGRVYNSTWHSHFDYEGSTVIDTRSSEEVLDELVIMSTKFGRVLCITWHSHDVEDSLSTNVMGSSDAIYKCIGEV